MSITEDVTMESKKAKRENIYYISAFYWRNYNAASKAKMDVEEIFERRQFNPIELFKDSYKGNIRVFSLSRLFGLVFSKKRKEFKDSTVFLQNGTGIDLLISPFIKLAFKKGKRIILIHDIESLRRGRKMDIVRERMVFSNFTHAVCHSEKMADFLKNELKFKGETYILGFFDYLVKSESDLDSRNSPKPDEKFKIAYAGNLSKWKSAFLYKIAEMNSNRYIFNLYGKGYDGPVMKNTLEFKGAFPPDELPAKLDGHFGLVWDGEDISQPSGLTGKYLQYNSPHKASLYIVSGLPLIVWKGSAVYKLVEQYNIGFGIDSLLELDERLKGITQEQYATWRANIPNLAKQLANGQSLGRVIDQILSE